MVRDILTAIVWLIAIIQASIIYSLLFRGRDRMSKSIYEDAFNHLDELVDALAHIEGSFLYRHYLDNIRLKLKQAQKQEKLLSLYKQFYDELKPNVFKFAVGDYESSEYLDFETDDTTKCIEIFKKIKELENEINRIPNIR